MTPSAQDPDWSREACTGGWQPSRRLLRSLRAYQRPGTAGFAGGLRRRLAVLHHRFWSAVTGADIPLNAQIAGGLLLPHPNGVVIHPDAVVGPNCLLFQQVTLGTTAGRSGAPRLGGHVDVGAGAKLLGPVSIGDHAVIGANAVVLSDIPAGAVAVGSPARVIKQKGET
ncbi:serine acetyltransferase [Epibacterium ulvae]|uniref:serine O-acetyltransferase n=1 Tax=Epibacterium ulvae TaxID=1156985 RepID=UPI001BFCC728|nr:serine acetyltransferase [Epibacterium ulvae]MBT8154503.1 serine acetyltransferase [Epibacterium ulvae]